MKLWSCNQNAVFTFCENDMAQYVNFSPCPVLTLLDRSDPSNKAFQNSKWSWILGKWKRHQNCPVYKLQYTQRLETIDWPCKGGVLNSQNWQKAWTGDSVEADCLTVSLKSLSLALSLFVLPNGINYQVDISPRLNNINFFPTPFPHWWLDLAQSPASIWLVTSKSHLMLLLQYIAWMYLHLLMCSLNEMLQLILA